MKNGLSMLCVGILSSIGVADALADTASEHTVTGNLAVVSDYRFRGLSQTFAEGFDAAPAIQGGIDYAHSSGWYIGNWDSNVSGNSYPNGASLEMDFYGGYRWTIGDVGLDLGTIYYAYPDASLPSGGGSFEDIDNWEAYLSASWKWLSVKYYYAFTDYFGLTEEVLQNAVGCSPAEVPCSALPLDGDTDGTQYVTMSASYPLSDALTLGASVGYTDVASYDDLNYTDYKLGVTYVLSGWSLGLNVVGSDADEKYWYACEVQDCTDSKTKEIGEPTLVVSIGKTF
jgi:uncharacterized protein (TIGR02001 family)